MSASGWTAWKHSADGQVVQAQRSRVFRRTASSRTTTPHQHAHNPMDRRDRGRDRERDRDRDDRSSYRPDDGMRRFRDFRDLSPRGGIDSYTPGRRRPSRSPPPAGGRGDSYVPRRRVRSRSPRRPSPPPRRSRSPRVRDRGRSRTPLPGRRRSRSRTPVRGGGGGRRSPTRVESPREARYRRPVSPLVRLDRRRERSRERTPPPPRRERSPPLRRERSKERSPPPSRRGRSKEKSPPLKRERTPLPPTRRARSKERSLPRSTAKPPRSRSRSLLARPRSRSRERHRSPVRSPLHRSRRASRSAGRFRGGRSRSPFRRGRGGEFRRGGDRWQSGRWSPMKPRSPRPRIFPRSPTPLRKRRSSTPLARHSSPLPSLVRRRDSWSKSPLLRSPGSPPPRLDLPSGESIAEPSPLPPLSRQRSPLAPPAAPQPDETPRSLHTRLGGSTTPLMNAMTPRGAESPAPASAPRSPPSRARSPLHGPKIATSPPPQSNGPAMHPERLQHLNSTPTNGFVVTPPRGPASVSGRGPPSHPRGGHRNSFAGPRPVHLTSTPRAGAHSPNATMPTQAGRRPCMASSATPPPAAPAIPTGPRAGNFPYRSTLPTPTPTRYTPVQTGPGATIPGGRALPSLDKTSDERLARLKAEQAKLEEDLKSVQEKKRKGLRAWEKSVRETERETFKVELAEKAFLGGELLLD